MPLVTSAADLMTTAEAGLPPTVIRDQCGTPAGYYRHWRRGEQPCDPCQRAYRVEQRDYHRRHSDNWAVRAWCRSVGRPVGPRGPVRQGNVDAYRAAQVLAVLTPDDPDLPAEEA
jgi:hypothetical protein